jgi:HEPN domain-containing protein
VEKATDGYPPREHNLTLLAQKAGVDLSKDRKDFFDGLSKQYMPTRYPDVEIELGVEYSHEQAQNYYERTAEEFRWLREQLK